MNTYITSCGTMRNPFTGEHEPRIFVTRAPLRWFLAYTLTDLVYIATRHRWCGLGPFGWVRDRVREHEEDFEFAVTDEIIQRYAIWRGWATWDTFADYEDEESDEFLSE